MKTLSKISILTAGLILTFSSAAQAFAFLEAGTSITEYNFADRVQRNTTGKFNGTIQFTGLTGKLDIPVGTVGSMSIEIPYLPFKKPYTQFSTQSLSDFHYVDSVHAYTNDRAFQSSTEVYSWSSKTINFHVNADAEDIYATGKTELGAMTPLNLITGRSENISDITIE